MNVSKNLQSLLPQSVCKPASAPISSDYVDVSSDQKCDSKCDVSKTSTLQSAPIPVDTIRTFYKDVLTTQLGSFNQGSRREKHFVQTQTDTNVSTSVTNLLLNAIPFGATTPGDGARLGSQVKQHFLTIKLRLFYRGGGDAVPTGGGALNSLTGVHPPPLRFVVVVDKMPIAGAPVWADDAFPPVQDNTYFLTAGGGIVNNTVAVTDFLTHNIRYKILHDHVVDIGAITAVSSGGAPYGGFQEKIYHVKVPLHGLVTSWFANTGSDVLENGIYFSIIQDADRQANQSSWLFGLMSDLVFEDPLTAL